MAESQWNSVRNAILKRCKQRVDKLNATDKLLVRQWKNGPKQEFIEKPKNESFLEELEETSDRFVSELFFAPASSIKNGQALLPIINSDAAFCTGQASCYTLFTLCGLNCNNNIMPLLYA